MKAIYVAIAFCLFAGPAFGQNQAESTAENPLAVLKDQVKGVLETAKLPFTDEQEKAIVLMMEDRRKASEDLFGDLQNFSAGPTQGQNADRLNSAIEWMRNEFLSKLQDYLQPEQLAAWSRARETALVRTATAAGARAGAPPRQQNQTQYVRINNNILTAEDGSYRGTGVPRAGTTTPATEVIQRGGAGAWHGNAQFLFKHDKLNAGRRFAPNKPPYQERQTNLDVSGPMIPGRLTTSFSFSQTDAQNVDTINAKLPDNNVFSLGITRPSTVRTFSANNTVQLSDSTSLSFNGGYSTTGKKNQGVGGFILPERAFTNDSDIWNFEVKQFSSLSARSIYETRFNYSGSHDETTPITEAVQINVTDAFSNGGAQNTAANTGRTYEFSNLYTRLGEKVSLKTGLTGVYRKNRSVSQSNFLGAFSFSSLDAYRQQRPTNYRIMGGNPNLTFDQWELGFFAQNDVKLTSRFTLMQGLRYEVQTNLRDHNNFDPRVGFAYAMGKATVIRGGAGVFHQRMPFAALENQIRRNGVWQYELVVNNPSYPNPFQAGTLTPPSVRVTDPRLVTPYSLVTMLSVERTFLSNLFVSVAWDRNREAHRPRPRNLNAPLDMTSPTPASCKLGQSKETCVKPYPDQGNIISMEPSGSQFAQSWKFSMRERFSIFNVSANYNLSWSWLDATPASNYGNGQTAAGYGPDGLGSDNYDLAADWSLITSPLHTVNTTVNARLPLGIFLTNTMAFSGHGRYTVTTGKDDNQDTTVNDRPVGLARNSEIAPNSMVFNFNISKAFFFGPASSGRGATRKNVNVFADMTNAFNRPNYAVPSGVMTSPNFGKSTSAGDPRLIDVGLRYQF